MIIPFYVFRAQPILPRLQMANKMDNILYENLIKDGLRFLPFWNLVSMIL